MLSQLWNSRLAGLRVYSPNGRNMTDTAMQVSYDCDGMCCDVLRWTSKWKMVGFDPGVIEMPKLAYGVAGGMSGFLTRAVTQPLDVLKIRLQVGFLYFLT